VFELGKHTNDGPVIGATVGFVLIVNEPALVPDVTAFVTVKVPPVELAVRLTVMVVSFTTVNGVETLLRVTDVAPVKFEPVNVTTVVARSAEQTVVGVKLDTTIGGGVNDQARVKVPPVLNQAS
jgi:hypothetical protein